MKIKVQFMNALKLGRLGLGDAPQVPDTIDLVHSIREFVFTMTDATMLLVVKVHETVIDPESISLYNGINPQSFPDNRHQFVHGAVFNNWCVHFPLNSQVRKQQSFLLLPAL